MATLAPHAPGGVVVIDCVDAVPTLPDGDWRREVGSVAQHVSADVAAYALVMSEPSLRRIAFGFIAAVLLWAQPAVPAAAFASTANAARWLRQRDALGRVREDQIEAVLEELRQRMDGHVGRHVRWPNDTRSRPAV